MSYTYSFGFFLASLTLYIFIMILKLIFIPREKIFVYKEGKLEFIGSYLLIAALFGSMLASSGHTPRNPGLMPLIIMNMNLAA